MKVNTSNLLWNCLGFTILSCLVSDRFSIVSFLDVVREFISKHSNGCIISFLLLLLLGQLVHENLHIPTCDSIEKNSETNAANFSSPAGRSRVLSKSLSSAGISCESLPHIAVRKNFKSLAIVQDQDLLVTACSLIEEIDDMKKESKWPYNNIDNNDHNYYDKGRSSSYLVQPISQPFDENSSVSSLESGNRSNTSKPMLVGGTETVFTSVSDLDTSSTYERERQKGDFIEMPDTDNEEVSNRSSLFFSSLDEHSISPVVKHRKQRQKFSSWQPKKEPMKALKTEVLPGKPIKCMDQLCKSPVGKTVKIHADKPIKKSFRTNRGHCEGRCDDRSGNNGSGDGGGSSSSSSSRSVCGDGDDDGYSYISYSAVFDECKLERAFIPFIDEDCASNESITLEDVIQNDF